MSVKVAIATSDGINVDLHFGQANAFFIYELKGSKFELTEKREVPVVENESTSPDTPSESDFGSGCGGGGFGCGSGGGCGGSGGGCGGGAGGPLAPAVELLLDCRSVVAAQIGQGMGRQLQRKAISVVDIELPINEALEKLAAYYTKFGE